MFRKVAVLALALALVSSALTGCGSSSSKGSAPAAGNKQEAASTYPEKEIRLIVPYAPGGQSDLTARKIADVIQKQNLLSKPVIVVNLNGGNTQEGLKAVKDAKPDGYTLLLHHTAFLTMKALGQMTMTYQDFDMIGQALEMPFVIVARKDAAWADAKALMEDAQKNPGKYSIGVAGFGGAGHFAELQFLDATKSMNNFKLVPYSGGNEAVTNLMGKQVDLMVGNTADVLRYIKSGDLKVLAVLGQEQSADFPGVLTMKDMGITSSLLLRNGLFAPKNMPQAVKDKWASVMKTVIQSDDFKQFAKEQGAKASYLDATAWSQAYQVDDKLVQALAGSVKK